MCHLTNPNNNANISTSTIANTNTIHLHSHLSSVSARVRFSPGGDMSSETCWTPRGVGIE